MVTRPCQRRSTSTAGAIAALYRGIPVIHAEAGLRSFNLFSPYINQHERFLQENRVRKRQGLIPDVLYDPGSGSQILGDFKTLHVGSATYTALDLQTNAGAVNRRARGVHAEYQRKARIVDTKYNATPEGANGPVHRRLGDFGRIRGYVAGAFGEVSKDFLGLIESVAGAGADQAVDPEAGVRFSGRAG